MQNSYSTIKLTFLSLKEHILFKPAKIFNFILFSAAVQFTQKTNICWVGIKIRVWVKGVKRIPIGVRRDHYAIVEIFTSANMTMMELDK